MKMLDPLTTHDLVPVFLMYAQKDVSYLTPFGAAHTRSNLGPSGREVIGVTVASHEPGRAAWANRPGSEWPLSKLRTAEGMLWFYLDTRGNLVDVDGAIPDDITSDEVSAFLADVLIEAADQVTEE